MMKKIAMMGGSFDPVHEGHISYARDVLKKTPVDEVVFMPAKLQPFKLDLELSSFEDRIEMIRLAIRKEASARRSESSAPPTPSTSWARRFRTRSPSPD